MHAELARTLQWAAWAVLGAALLGVAITLLLDAEMSLVDMLEAARRRPELLWTAALVYALCLAVPYMPGVELGILLMLVFGRPGILAAYLGTLAGLNLAFLAGALIRRRLRDRAWLAPWRAKAANWVRDGSVTLTGSAWLQRLVQALRRRGGIGHYVLIGVFFNLPGNWVLGGGGGIALIGGLSGRLSWHGFAATVALATCLVPLAATFGFIDLKRWLEVLS